MTLRTLIYGNYGIFLIMGNAGFCPSAVETTRGWLGPGPADAVRAIGAAPAETGGAGGSLAGGPRKGRLSLRFRGLGFRGLGV